MKLWHSVLLVAVVLTVSACNAMVQSAYLMGNGKLKKKSEETAPTGESIVVPAYRVERSGSASRLVCSREERSILRSATVYKEYSYRGGGYEPMMYKTTTLLSGLIAAGVLGTYAAVCSKEDASEGCWNTLAYFSPLALDIGYGLYKVKTAREPVLSDRSISERGLRLGELNTPAQYEECRVRVVLGRAQRPPPQGGLNQNGEYLGSDLISESVISLPMGPAGRLDFSSVAKRWLEEERLMLWAVDAADKAHPVFLDPCDILAPHRAQVDPRQWNRRCLPKEHSGQ